MRCRQVTSVKLPSEFIIMADTSVDGVYDFAITVSDAGQNTRWGQTTVPGKVHRGGANVLFCDGHVQWYLQSDLICKDPAIPQDAAKQRIWNADNLPAGDW
jgi:prepilin-type processing-associated H-X9-DG protein